MRLSRLTSRIMMATALMWVLTSLLGPPVHADDNAGSSGGAYTDDEGNPTAWAGDVEDPPGAPDGSSNRDCRWFVSVDDDFDVPVWGDGGVRVWSETGRWIIGYCLDDEGNPTDDTYFFPEAGQVDPAALALLAEESLEIPSVDIGLSPPAGRLVVHVPTWLWVDGGWWQSYSETASAGRVTSTVTATPVSVSWSMGDGSTVVCDGPGVPWSPGQSESATDCSHTYTAADEVVPLTATVTLSVSWSSNTGASGVLDAATSTGSVEATVGEIQAIQTA